MTLKVLSSVGNDVLYGLDTDLLLLPCSTYEPHVGSRAGLNLGKAAAVTPGEQWS